jgi:16S rRNA (guanine966-N2)-methyltransferase
VRIISGILKARRFTAPKNFPSRPTTDFAKEGLFNMLEHQMSLFDLDILDLCAGTGNISFEFLSREAGNVTAVDSNDRCVAFIRKTAAEFGIADHMQTIRADIQQFVARTERRYDLIFADPPYKYEGYVALVQKIQERELLNEHGTLIVEHGKETNLSHLAGYQYSRNYGNVHFSFFKRSS